MRFQLYNLFNSYPNDFKIMSASRGDAETAWCMEGLAYRCGGLSIRCDWRTRTKCLTDIGEILSFNSKGIQPMRQQPE
jgi:hypothetical protein